MAAVGKGVVQIQADHIENVYARAGVARAYQLGGTVPIQPIHGI